MGSAVASAGMGARRRARQLVPRLALSALALAVCLLLLEGAVRLFLPQQLLFYRPDLYRLDEHLGWRFAPDLDTRVNTGERDVRLLTDAWGLRIGKRSSMLCAIVAVARKLASILHRMWVSEPTSTSASVPR